jgi:MYXO-CTERM domain-containing protein
VNATLALALVSACVADLGRDRQPITNGTDDDGDPAVVALLQAGILLCSGTLIAPRVVLTAGHCIDGVDQVVFGSTIALPSATRGVLVARAHPDFDADTLAHDIGLVLLDEPAPTNAAPIEIGEATAAAAVRLVGYGRIDGQDLSEPRKREGTSVIDSLEVTSFRITPAPSQACEGDSGGPAFVGAVLVGVTSEGDPACAEYTVYTRAAVYLAEFVDPFVAATRDGAVSTGGRCYDDANCAEGSCVFPADAPTIGYCTRACAGDAECPSPMRCEAMACTHALPSPGAPGSGCAEATACDSDVCAQPMGGEPVCAERCVPGIFECDEGFECGADIATNGSSACFAVDAGGGCCSASDRPGQAAWLAILVMAFAARRRKHETPRG